MTETTRLDARELMTPGRLRQHERWLLEGWYQGADMGALLTSRLHLSERELVAATREGTVVVTARDVLVQAHALADRLDGAGLQIGDRVLVQLGDPVPRWTALTAVALGGYVLVPIPAATGQADIDHIARDCAARAAIVATSWHGRPVSGLGIGARVGSIRVVVVDGGGESGDEIGLGAVLTADQTGRSGTRPDRPLLEPHDPFTILYTSGSTGLPKAVCHSHGTFWSEMRLGHDTGSGSAVAATQLSPYPGGHLSALTGDLRALLWNARTVVMSEWHDERAYGLVEDWHVATTNGTPTFLRALVERRAALGGRRRPLHYRAGAAAVPADLVRDAEAVGISAFRCYGSSEHPTVTTGSALLPLEVRARHDGYLLPSAELRVVADDGRPLGFGEVGSIETTGPDQFVGYLDPELTTSAFTDDGWYRTGDDGRLDASGLLTVLGRRAEVINRGGEKLSPAEIEAVLLRLEGVSEAVVVAVPDRALGQRAYAFLAPTGGAWQIVPSLAAVRDHFRSEHVSIVKTPEFVEARDELPRLHNGKIDRADLRRSAVARVASGERGPQPR